MKRTLLILTLLLIFIAPATTARQEPMMPIEQFCEQYADFMVQECGLRPGGPRCPGSWLDFYMACLLGN